MRRFIVCEGATDLILLQSFMEKANNWRYKAYYEKMSFKQVHILEKSNLELYIGECGNDVRAIDRFEELIKFNKLNSYPDKFWRKIVIVTDNDDSDTIPKVIEKIKTILSNYSVVYKGAIQNDRWKTCEILDGTETKQEFDILLLVLPFDKQGALETFLLDAICKKDAYDKKIIEQGNEFVDNIDPEKRYLRRRGDITKAKFNVYFSVRTTNSQFRQRKSILRDSVNWSEFEHIQKSFIKLRDLG